MHAVASVGAEVVERTADVVFAVSASGALFSGSPAEELPDDDLNLLHDALRFRWPVDFTTEGQWIVTAELRDQTDELVSELNVTLSSPPGSSTQDALLTVHAADLVRHGVTAKYLYYPTENHWILTPGNSRVWYETVWAFLAKHVLDQDWERPELL